MAQTKILLVEDEPNIAESLSFILQRAGFDVEIVSDGSDAMTSLRRQSYGVLLLDIMLPGTNGFDILRTIREDPLLKALPVIVLTAKGQANDRQLAETIGANAFITKPFSNAEVVACVQEFAEG